MLPFEKITMKPLLAALALMFVSSCSTYQYLTITSDKTTKNEAKELLWENDTVKLAFNFNGSWGTLKLTVLNKTDQPISINWQKSSIIYNNVSYSLFDNSVQLNGDIQRNESYNRSQTASQTQPLATVNGSFKLPNTIVFVPPHSLASQQNLNFSKVIPSTFALPANLPVEKLTTETYTVKFKKAIYDSSSTPFKFRVFLTFGMGGNGQEFYSERLFYVAEVKQTDEGGVHQVLISLDGDKCYYKLMQ
jgi:hypothetical protein